MYKYIEEQFPGRSVAACTGYDYSNTDVDTESLTLSGAVTVQIDTGSGIVARGGHRRTARLCLRSGEAAGSAPASSALRAAMMPEPRRNVPPMAGPVIPPLRRRLVGRRKLVRKQIDQQTMSITLDLEQSSVVPWTIHPRGTMQTLLPEISRPGKAACAQTAPRRPVFCNDREPSSRCSGSLSCLIMWRSSLPMRPSTSGENPHRDRHGSQLSRYGAADLADSGRRRHPRFSLAPALDPGRRARRCFQRVDGDTFAACTGLHRGAGHAGHRSRLRRHRLRDAGAQRPGHPGLRGCRVWRAARGDGSRSSTSQSLP